METPKDNFKSKWAKAFEEASIEPSERVWAGIDNKLLLAENKGYKRRVLIYKYVAAAAIIIAISVGWFGFGGFDQDINQLSGFDNLEQPINQPNELAQPSEVPQTADNISSPAETPLDNQLNNSESSSSPNLENIESTSEGLVADLAINENRSREETMDVFAPLEPLAVENRGETVVVKQYGVIHEPLEYNFAVPVGYPVHQEFIKPERSRLTDVWASVGMGGGSFNLNPGSRSFPSLGFAADEAMQFSDANTIPTPQTQTSVEPGYSYSVGVNLGTKLGDRFAVKGGVGYSYKGLSARSNSYAVDTKSNSSNALLFASASREQNTVTSNTGSYPLQSDYEFMTLPIEAGYLVMDKKFGIMITSGVETNLLMKSELSADIPGWVNSTDISQYRRVHLSALIGTDFHYIFRDHYAFSVEPGYKISINSLTNERSGFDSYPRGFDINMRLRYLF